MNSSSNQLYREPERLKRKPLLGNTFDVLRDPVEFLGNLPNNYGPVVTAHFLGKKYFVLQHPEYIKHVLLQNHKTYTKPGATKLLSLFLGEGLSTSNGELWLRQRRVMQPAFHKQRLSLILNIIDEETSLFISNLKFQLANKTINISHEFLQLTISIISRAMFSSALKDEMKTMTEALESLAAYASVWMKTLIKIPTNWPTPANHIFRKNCKVFDEIICSIIQRRKTEMRGLSYVPKGDLLDMLLSYFDEETNSGMSDKQLRDEVTTMFMAGHETTAQTLSWIMYHLAKDNDINERVKQEAADVQKDGPLKLEDLPKLVYTKQVIQEALRCYPPIWALVRKPINKDEIIGIRVPASSHVLINIYGMHHHPDYWETPGEFNPAHFNTEPQEQRPQFAYLPFGGGPRLCLGNNFATMVMQVVVSRLAQQFEFEIPDGYVPKVEPNITLRAKDGIQLILKHLP